MFDSLQENAWAIVSGIVGAVAGSITTIKVMMGVSKDVVELKEITKAQQLELQYLQQENQLGRQHRQHIAETVKRTDTNVEAIRAHLLGKTPSEPS